MKKIALTTLFYGVIGLVASLALFLVFYLSLRLNASIDNLVKNFYSLPLYFWPYVTLTLGTIILFGINVPLLVYHYRKYGFPKFGHQASGGLGAVIGIFASACPVCGSTLLSAIGVTAGLAAFPFGGLELKALSFGLMALPLALTGKELLKFSKGGEACPVPRDSSYRKKDRKILVASLITLLLLLFVIWNLLKTDPAIVNLLRPANANRLISVDETAANTSLHQCLKSDGQI